MIILKDEFRNNKETIETVFNRAFIQLSKKSSVYVPTNKYSYDDIIRIYKKYQTECYIEVYYNGVVISTIDGRTNQPIDNVINELILTTLSIKDRAYHLFLDLKDRMGTDKYLTFGHIDVEATVITFLRDLVKKDYSIISRGFEDKDLDNGFVLHTSCMVRNCDLFDIADKIKNNVIK